MVYVSLSSDSRPMYLLAPPQGPIFCNHQPDYQFVTNTSRLSGLLAAIQLNAAH